MIGERVFRRGMALALAALLCGAIAAVWGFLTQPAAFFTAWLCAFFYWLAMPLAALALLMIHDLTGGKWEAVARRPLECIVATLPLFILLFLPIAFGMHDLYSWSRPAVMPAIRNRWYLAPGFFGGRAAAYFVIWNFFAFLQLWRPHGEGKAAPSAQWISGIGLILLGYSFTFATIDWLMSIEPDWFSTIYGMMVGAGQFVAGLALVLLIVSLTGPPLGVDRQAFARHLANLATILLAVDIFWAYTAYSQWLVIWEENLRTEIPWYVERLRPGWRALLLIIAGTHFVVPFFLLVWTPAKRSRWLVGGVAALLLPAHLLQVWWLVLPAFRTSGFTWLHPLIALGMGGLWCSLLLWRLRYGRLLPLRAVQRAEVSHG